MTRRRYETPVYDLLDFARAARRLATRHPEYVDEGDVMQYIDKLASDVGWSLLEIVLDHEEREARFVAMWRKWRKRRSSRHKRTRK